MQVYQLKTRMSPDEIITIGTYLMEQDAFEALADWSENERYIKSQFDGMSELLLERHYTDLVDKLPEHYVSYHGEAWLEVFDVILNYDPKSMDFDKNIFDL